MDEINPPEVIELFDIIAELLPRAVCFDGAIVRSVGTKYANEKDFLTGDGAARFGGRWNSKGVLAVYGSTDILTATMEAYQLVLDYGFSLSSLQPRVTAGANVKLSLVFDLTSNSIRKRIGFTLSELLDENWQLIQSAGEESWTQAIGRGCRAAGYEALLVPSARRRKGQNLVIFPDQVRPTSFVKVLEKDALPPHPSTWPTK